MVLGPRSFATWSFPVHSCRQLGWVSLLVCGNLLARMKDIFVTDLAGYDEGRTFDSFFLVLGKQQRATKQNKPYLNLVLGDPRIAKDFDRGDIVKVRGSVTRFDERTQVKVDQMRKAAPDEADKMDMLPATTKDVGELWAQLEAAVDGIANPDLKRLLTAMLGGTRLAEAF